MRKPVRRRLIATALALFASAGGAAQAAEIEVAPPIAEALFSPYPVDLGAGLTLEGVTVDLSGYGHIRLTGEIVPGDAERLGAAIAALRLGDADRFGTTVLSLSSPGGNFAEALALGDLLTRHGIGTYVGAGDVCLSACAFVFLGGNRMVTRNIYYAPWRQMHEDATIGFHAPSLPGSLPSEVVDAAGADLVFAEIARPTLENVRHLQDRADRWFLPTDFLFDVLGRVGTEEFHFLRTLEQTSRLGITVVREPSPDRPGIALLEARTACEMVVREYMREFPFSDLFGGLSVSHAGASGFAETNLSRLLATPDELGREAFHFDILMRGFGTYECLVEWHPDGFRVTFPGGLFENLSGNGTDELPDGRIVFRVHPRGVIGHALPWSAVGAEDLLVDDRDALLAVWPGHYRRIADGFDFCSPRDPQTWEVICRFETVHTSVRLLTAVVETHRADHADAASLYSDWQQDVRRFCRPGSGAGDLRETMLGYCALAVTQRQLARAADLWLVAE